MLVVVIACLAGLAVVIVALARDEPPATRVPAGAPPAPARAARARFPLASLGYEPAAVEDYLDAVARAVAEVLAIAPPEVVARARRVGLLAPESSEDGSESAPAPAAQAGVEPAVSLDTEDHEALRAEAALVVIESRGLPTS